MFIKLLKSSDTVPVIFASIKAKFIEWASKGCGRSLGIHEGEQLRF